MLWILSGIGFVGAMIYSFLLLREIFSASRKMKYVRNFALLVIMFTSVFAVSIMMLCDLKQSCIETVKTVKYNLTSVTRNDKSVYMYYDSNDTYTYHFKSEDGPKTATIFAKDAYIEERDECSEPMVIQKVIETTSEIDTSWQFFLTFCTDYDYKKEYHFYVPTGTVER